MASRFMRFQDFQGPMSENIPSIAGEHAMQALRDAYLRSRERLAAARQAHIERLGDWMCNRSHSPPNAEERAQLEALGETYAGARALYEAACLGIACALVQRIGRTASRSPVDLVVAASRRPR